MTDHQPDRPTTLRVRDIDRLIAIAAHEIRSPLSTILGFEELLSDGLIGTIDKAAAEALQRIRSAALQLLTISRGLETLAGTRPDATIQDIPPGAGLTLVVRRLTTDAAARDVELVIDTPPDILVRAEPETLPDVIELTIHACFKAQAGNDLLVRFEPAPEELLVHFSGTAVNLPDRALRPLRDDVIDETLDGVAFRLAIARRTAERAGGSLLATTGAAPTITLRLRRPPV